VEIFHIRTEEETRKTQARRKKQQREKGRGKSAKKPELEQREADDDVETSIPKRSYLVV